MNNKTYVYLAGPWFTDEAKSIHDKAKSIIKNCENVKGIFPDEMSKGMTPEETFMNNVVGIETCNIVVALVDVKDVGTAWEIGMAYQLGKPIYLVGKNIDTFKRKTNLMLCYTGRGILLDDLGDILEHPDSSKYVNINRVWEDIE